METKHLKRQLLNLENRISEFEKKQECELEDVKNRIDVLEGKHASAKEPIYVKDVVKIVHLTRCTIYRLAKADRIPCHRPSKGKLTFYEHEIREWMLQNNSKPKDKKEELRKVEEWKAIRRSKQKRL